MLRPYPSDPGQPTPPLPHPPSIGGIDVPPMTTLAHRPTWHNRAGNVDRSACVTLNISDVRTHAAMHDVMQGSGSRRIDPEHAALMGLDPYTQLEPGMHLPTGREAIGKVRIIERTLEHLHQQLRNCTLVGDYRTSKSNALKPPQVMRRPPGPLPTEPFWNPNRGYGRPKILALGRQWSQTIGVERWRFHDRLTRYYFMCPNSHAQDSDCLGKVFKLYMPLAYVEEHEDARTAFVFLREIAARFAVDSDAGDNTDDGDAGKRDRCNEGGDAGAAMHRAIPIELLDFRRQLMQRYGPLMPPRRLLCRTCLGMHYGGVRPEVMRAKPWNS